MIKLLKRKEINTILWDQCVERSPEGEVFCYSWYLDACCPDWMALVDGMYETVFPFAMRTKIGINYLYQPYFVRHFAVISRTNTTAEQRLSMLGALPDAIMYYDFCLGRHHHEAAEGFRTDERIYQALSLSQAYDDIHGRYSENLKRNIRKATKRRLTLIRDNIPARVAEGFRRHQGEKLEKFSTEDFDRLNRLMHTAQENCETWCLGIKDDRGKEHAGAFFLRTGDTVLYLKGFTSPEGKESGAMHFLFDHLIQELAGSDLTLDFGGSSVKSVARFNHQFGSSDHVYLHVKMNRLPKPLRWLKH